MKFLTAVGLIGLGIFLAFTYPEFSKQAYVYIVIAWDFVKEMWSTYVTG